MRFYSLVDLFEELGSSLVDLTDHEITNQLGAVWETFTDPIAQITPALKAVVFTSTQRAARANFLDHAEDGFKDQFQLRLTQRFSEDSGSAGQQHNHIIVDDNDEGYIIEIFTDGGDNDDLTYRIQEYDSGVLTSIPGLSGSVTRPDGLFNVFASMDEGVLSIKLDLEDELTASAPNNHDFAEYKFQGTDPGDTDTSYFTRLYLLGDLSDPVFIEEYTDLLIKQYHEKPKAFAEIELQAKTWSNVYSILTEIPEEMDIDLAFGSQLDTISKLAFGFIARNITGTAQTLTDEQLRSCVKIKIGKNWASSFMVSDDRISIQDVIQQIFLGGAFVVDNYDMALTLYIDQNVDPNTVIKANELDLLPHGQGVRYRAIVQYTIDGTFGFADNPNALTWDDKFLAVSNPGKFAEKVF